MNKKIKILNRTTLYFLREYQDIAKHVRGINCSYFEIRFIIQPPAILFTFIFSLLNITPNIVSSLSLCISFLSIYLFYYEIYHWAFLFFILRTVLDYTDGALARYMKMTSKFGKYFDLAVDWVFFVPFWICLATIYKDIWFLFIILPIYVLLVEFWIEPNIPFLKKRVFPKDFFMKKKLLIGFAPFGIFELWTYFFSLYWIILL